MKYVSTWEQNRSLAKKYFSDLPRRNQAFAALYFGFFYIYPHTVKEIASLFNMKYSSTHMWLARTVARLKVLERDIID